MRAGPCEPLVSDILDAIKRAEEGLERAHRGFHAARLGEQSSWANLMRGWERARADLLQDLEDAIA